MAKMYINPNVECGKIHKEIQGHFSEHLGRCIYEGLFVKDDSGIDNVNGMRTDVVQALKEMKIPVLRWPGGSFADEYHWKDGIGPVEKRKKMINTHWGGVLEDNSFGTKEFMELCRQLGCETYINGNVGSGTVQEMSEWVEYMTFDGVSPMADLRKENGNEDPWTVNFFGVGNENWGCGGNMTPEYYANEYRRYQTYVRHYPDSKNPGKPRIYKIACGANSADYNWTDTVMKIAGNYMDGISLHHYTITHDWSKKGSATDFTKEEYYMTMKGMVFTDELINKHVAIMDKYDPAKRVGLIFDEWGTWYDVEPGTNPGFLYQQNTMRDAIVAGTTLNIFNKHCDRVRMANIAQLINVLQAVILTDGAQMIKTPTYHIFKMYKAHQDAELLDSYIETEKVGLEDTYMVPNLTESVSLGKDGKIHITLTNLSCSEAYEIESELTDTEVKEVIGEIVTGDIHDHNTFEDPEKVTVKAFDEAKAEGNVLKFTIPAASVLHLTLTI